MSVVSAQGTPSAIRRTMSPPMSLNALVHPTTSPAASTRADDTTTLDGRSSVIGSITSERRKPRKLDIRSIPEEPVRSFPRPTAETVDAPAMEDAQPPNTETRRRRKPRKLNRNPDEMAEIREESRGGVALNQLGPGDPRAVSNTQLKDVHDEQPHANDKQAFEAPTSTHDPVRRRPRKLERNRLPNALPEAKSDPRESNPASSDGPVNTEIEALKDRVRELEAQVRELYERPAVVSARSPRRRGKGRKSSADATSHSEDLSQLQAELVDARNQLAALKIQQGAATADTTFPIPHPDMGPTRSTRSSRTRPRLQKSPQPFSDDNIEVIPRASVPSVEAELHNPQRAVTLSGSYQFRLPENLDMRDIKALQDGVTSASNIAKTLVATPGETARSAGREGDGKSWGEWIGSYSQSIARVMPSIKAEAAMEKTPNKHEKSSWELRDATTRQHLAHSTTEHAPVARRPPLLDRVSSSTMTPEAVDRLLE